MAQVNQRLWKIPGQGTKRKAWGFTAQINGKQVRRYKAEWTQDDAEAELAKALLHIEPQKRRSGITFSDAAERYLAAKSRKKSVAFDKLYLHQLSAAFGAQTRSSGSRRRASAPGRPRSCQRSTRARSCLTRQPALTAR